MVNSIGVIFMTYNYNRLWKLLIDNGVRKTQMRLQAGISTNILTKTGKGEPVAKESLVKIERFTYKGKTCSIELYNLRIVIALGFKMNGLTCQRFRKWVASRLAESYQRKPSALFLYMGKDTFIS